MVSNSTTGSSCPSEKEPERPRFCNFAKRECNCLNYWYEDNCKDEKYCDEEKKSCNCTEPYKECNDLEIWVGGDCVSGIQMMIDFYWIDLYINVTYHKNVKFS